MTKREAYRAGYDRGYDFGRNAEIEDMEDGEGEEEAIIRSAAEAESNDRQSSDFVNGVLQDLNRNPDRMEVLWDEFDRGLFVGIKAGIKDR